VSFVDLFPTIFSFLSYPTPPAILIAKSPHQAEAMQKTLEKWLTTFTPMSTEGVNIKLGKKTLESLRVLGYIK
jgi:hypothetical protein